MNTKRGMNHKISTGLLIGLIIIIMTGIVFAEEFNEFFKPTIKNDKTIQYQGDNYIKEVKTWNELTKTEKINQLNNDKKQFEDELKDLTKPTTKELAEFCKYSHPYYVALEQKLMIEEQIESLDN